MGRLNWKTRGFYRRRDASLKVCRLRKRAASALYPRLLSQLPSSYLETTQNAGLNGFKVEIRSVSFRLPSDSCGESSNIRVILFGRVPKCHIRVTLSGSCVKFRRGEVESELRPDSPPEPLFESECESTTAWTAPILFLCFAFRTPSSLIDPAVDCLCDGILRNKINLSSLSQEFQI